MTDINDTAPPAATKKGWPKGKKRGPRVARQEVYEDAVQAAPVRESTRQVVREGAAQAVGRDGEVLTRKRPNHTDIFFIPPNIIPQSWDYQWNVVEVLGQQQTATTLAMAENGWRPVPAGRHKGMFMPANYPENGEIIRDGMRLEERPMALTLEARHEERMKADRLMRDQQEQLGLTQKMPSGFSRDNPNLRRAERSQTSRTYAPAGDIPRPQLPIDPTT